MAHADALIAQARRDPRFAQAALRGLTVGVVGDPVVVAWLRLFVGVAAKEAA